MSTDHEMKSPEPRRYRIIVRIMSVRRGLPSKGSPDDAPGPIPEQL